MRAPSGLSHAHSATALPLTKPPRDHISVNGSTRKAVNWIVAKGT